MGDDVFCPGRAMRPLFSLLAILGLTLVIVLPGAGCARSAREPQDARTSRPWTEEAGRLGPGDPLPIALAETQLDFL